MRGSSPYFRRSSSRNNQNEYLVAREGPDITIEVDIPPFLVGKIIGHGGSTLDCIKARAGVFAYVHGSSVENPRAYVEIRGGVEQVCLYSLFS